MGAVTAEAAALAASVQNMAAGPLRDKYERKLRRLNERKAQLTDRQTDFGAVARLDNEFDQARLNAALTETAAYVAAVQARKAAL